MINEFDKEMDVLLRKARGGEALAAPGPHPDADTLAAFAENALPPVARQLHIAHLADCPRCRRILADLIPFNTEAAADSASVAAPAVTAEPGIPWYRKLFIFPQIAYVMGALVLVFSGFIAYVIFQGAAGELGEMAMSKDSNASRAMPATPANTTANTAAVSNTSVSANSPASIPAANVSVANTNAASVAAPKPASKSNEADAQPLAAVPPVPEATVPVRDEPGAVGAARRMPPSDDEKVAELSRAGEEAKKKEASNAVMATSPVPPAPAAKSQDKSAGAGPGTSRVVGGKTFRNIGGTWFDSAVGSQPQTVVRRGSEEYRKLDAGLRSITDQLPGTVVLLWEGKAYKIQ